MKELRLPTYFILGAHCQSVTSPNIPRLQERFWLESRFSLIHKAVLLSQAIFLVLLGDF